MYEKNKEDVVQLSYLDAKGIELVRRDNCALAKRIQKDVLDALMYKIDPDLACKILKDHMQMVVDDKFPIMDYKLSKSRRKDYKNEDLPHLAVVRKMQQRNPGSEPQVGDRVPFVLIETSNLKAKTFEKAEDIKYVEEKGLKIDRLYYTEHQIVNPICSLLYLCISDCKSLFTPYIRQLTHQRTKQSTIFSFLSKKNVVADVPDVPDVADVADVAPADVADMAPADVAPADVADVAPADVATAEDTTIETQNKGTCNQTSQQEMDFEDAMMNITARVQSRPTKRQKIKKR